MAQLSYCNTTTDLVGAYARIESARDLRVLNGYKPYTTANVFRIGKVGSFEVMFEDNTPMTLVTSIVLVDSAQDYYYDSTNDVLYFYPTGGVPENHTYRVGEDWSATKTRATQDASRDADALLGVKYSTPIFMSENGTVAAPYDRDLTKAVALMACGHIAARVEPRLYDSVGNPQNTSAQLYESGVRLLKDYTDGKRAFSWEITSPEVGKYNVVPTSTNTSAGIFQLRGKYNPTDDFKDAFWKVKIVLGGVLGTATYALSTDNGTTYGTAAATANTWAELSNDVYIRWLPRIDAAGDFVINDTWQIQLYGEDREITSPGIRTIPITII